MVVRVLVCPGANVLDVDPVTSCVAVPSFWSLPHNIKEMEIPNLWDYW